MSRPLPRARPPGTTSQAPNHSARRRKLKQTGLFLRGRAKLMMELARHPLLALRPCRYLFILSHMRSRSTLLSHILGSHPDVTGYLETHIRYRGPADFLRLKAAVTAAAQSAPLARYALDKVLHKGYIEAPLLERMRVVPIFLVRNPEESIQSLRHIMRDESDARAVQRSVTHYLRRVRWMKTCAKRLSHPGVFVESSSLIHSTAQVFRLLERELQLSAPLSESYEVRSETGKTRLGDPSELIKSGQIVKDGRTSYTRQVDVPDELLDEAREAYESCVEMLSRRCAHIGEGSQVSAISEVGNEGLVSVIPDSCHLTPDLSKRGGEICSRI